jgi:glycosyltransferase involved in cell wall biosynthesis
MRSKWCAQTILHVSSFLQGGAGRIACDLMLSQRQAGAEIFCLLNKKHYDGYRTYSKYLDELKKAGVNLLFRDYLFKRSLSRLPASTNDLSELIEAKGIDFVHCHTAWASRLCIRAIDRLSFSLPIIQTVHGWGGNKTCEQEEQDIEALNQIDAAVCVSSTDHQLLVAKGLALGHAFVVMNGISSLSGDLVREKKPWKCIQEHKSLGKTIVVCVGTICERKNQLALVQSMSKLKKHEVLAHLVLVGDCDPGYLNILKKEIKRLGLAEDITILEQRNDIREQLSWFDAYCSASSSEGLPLSVLEAYSAGLPVFLSSIDAHREIVNLTGVGTLVDMNEPSALADNLLNFTRLSSSDRKNLSSRHSAAFSASMELSLMLQGYQKLYNNLHRNNRVGV